MATVIHHSHSESIGHALLSPVRAVARALDYIRKSNHAASEYERLSHLTDERLARAGLSREDIPDYAIRRSDLF